VNVAVLEGDQIKVVDEDASSLPDCPPLLTSLLGFDSVASWGPEIDAVNLLVQLAVSMRAHGRGGLLLVVPEASDAWLDSIVRPIPYAVVPPFAQLAQLNRQTADEKRERFWQETVNRAFHAFEEERAAVGVEQIGVAADRSDQHPLEPFDGDIRRRKGSPQVEQVTMTEPIQKQRRHMRHCTRRNWAARDTSAAQFVHDPAQRGRAVASQDGRFTVFAWSPARMVHGHRVETLLL
jgi:hypothetical protein